MTVRVGPLIRETVRACWSRPAWAVTAALAALALGGACGAMVVTDASAVQARADRLDAKGWGLLTVVRADGAGLDPAVCSTIAGLDGIDAAGAVGPAEEVGALGLDAGLSLTAVSVAAIEVVWPAARYDPAADVLLSPGFVALSGVAAGTLHLQDGGALVPATTDVLVGQGRLPSLDGGALLLRRDLTEATSCVVDVAGDDVERAALDVAAAMVSSGVLAVPVVSADDAAPTPAELVRQHRARAWPLVAAIVLALVGAMRLVRSRRDRAVHRLLGLGRADLWLMGLVDAVVLLLVPATSAFAVVLLLAESRGVPTSGLGLLDLGLLLASSTAVVLGHATVCATGRNRHQFAPGA
ncbi:MAG TPA: hypothetical protein VGC67_15455 [Cellulomonas sp.]